MILISKRSWLDSILRRQPSGCRKGLAWWSGTTTDDLSGLYESHPKTAPQDVSSYDKSWKPTQVLWGKKNGAWKTMEAKKYPVRLCQILAQAHLAHARDINKAGEEENPPELLSALEALCNFFDPYLEEVKGSRMMQDYHKSST